MIANFTHLICIFSVPEMGWNFLESIKIKILQKKVMTLFSNKKLQKASKHSTFKKEMYSLLWPLLSLKLVKLWTLLKVKKSTFWNGTILIGKFHMRSIFFYVTFSKKSLFGNFLSSFVFYFFKLENAYIPLLEIDKFWMQSYAYMQTYT